MQGESAWKKQSRNKEFTNFHPFPWAVQPKKGGRHHCRMGGFPRSHSCFWADLPASSWGSWGGGDAEMGCHGRGGSCFVKCFVISSSFLLSGPIISYTENKTLGFYFYLRKGWESNKMIFGYPNSSSLRRRISPQETLERRTQWMRTSKNELEVWSKSHQTFQVCMDTYAFLRL